MKRITLLTIFYCCLFLFFGCEDKDDNANNSECSDTCSTPDETRCDNNTVEQCSKNEENCLSWKNLKNCTDSNQTCEVVGNEVECKDNNNNNCNHECENLEDKRCSENKIEQCTKDEEECKKWVVIKDCSDSEKICTIVDESVKCGEENEECTDECVAGKTRCLGNTIQLCKTNEINCLVWFDDKNCSDSNEACNSSGEITECIESTDFNIRTPSSNELSCGDPISENSFYDVDYLCTFKHGDIDTQIYIQATPSSCEVYMSAVPLFTNDSVTGWMKTENGIVSIQAGYDWGGNHHNDSINVKIENHNYVIYHSSIGFGWRACAPPDCILVCEEGVEICDSYSAEVDGCSREPGSGPPSLPVICVQILMDGSVPELLDPWTAYNSNSDYPLLPCLGDQ